MKQLTRIAVLSLLTFLASAGAMECEPQVHVLVGSRLPAEGGTTDAPSSPLTSPFGIDFNSHGEMYIVELAGGRIHRLTENGTLSRIAGDGSKGYSGDEGPAEHATFNGMHNVAISNTDDVYIADSWNHCIRRISAKTGTITTFAGTGAAGFRGDGAAAQNATFDFVMCIAFDPACEHLYIADINNHRIRAIDMKTNIVRTVAGNGKTGVPQNGDDAVASPLVDPRAVSADSNGNVYVLERGGHALRLVTPNGKIRTIAGTGEPGLQDGPALHAQLNAPKHLCLANDGQLFIADDKNHAIRRYDPRSNTLTTVLGHGSGKHAIRLRNPHGVAFENGRLYVVDMGHNRILRIE